jgi:hypothetical protein
MQTPDNQPDKFENLANAIAKGVVSLDKAKKLNSSNKITHHNFHHEFEEIDNASLEELKKKWCKLYNCKAAPGFSKTVLVYKLKYRLQELIYGGLSSEAKQLLKDAINEHILHKSKKPEYLRSYPVGTIITRNYQGRKYAVTVLQNGYSYNGVTYKNLTAIVKKITGTRYWSGARFFGLEK